jgi:TolA-binding protein
MEAKWSVSTKILSTECTRRKTLAVICAGVLVGGLSLLATAGCERMPAASSAKTVQVLAALRTAISVKSPERIEEMRQRIEEMHGQQELNDQEFEMMTRIIDMASSGDWKSAEQLCHRFQKAQIR